MKKKLLIGLGAIVGIIIIIAVIATTTGPETQPGQIEPAQPPQTQPTPGEITPTPIPTLTASEQAYATTIAEDSSKVAKAMSELGSLMSNPQIGNDDWTLKVAAQLATIRVLYDEAMEIEPPSSMTDIHYKYVQAMKHYETATHLIAQGIDELDADLINQAVAELETGNQLINEATELTQEFTKAHSK